MKTKKKSPPSFALPNAPIKVWRKLLNRLKCPECGCFLTRTPSGYYACWRSLQHGKLIPGPALVMEIGEMAREMGARNTRLGVFRKVVKRAKEIEAAKDGNRRLVTKET